MTTLTIPLTGLATALGRGRAFAGRAAGALLLALVLTSCGGRGGTAATSNSVTTFTLPLSSSTAGNSVTTASLVPDSTPTAVSTADAAASGAAQATATSSSGEVLVVTGTGGKNLLVRATPNGTIVTRVPPGAQLTALGEQQQAGSYVWLHVRTGGGVVGWVASQYVVATTPTPASS